MIKNEGELATNIQTLKECADKGPWHVDANNPCEKAFQEVASFMKQDGPLQEQLKSRDLINFDGKNLTFSTSIYPAEKPKK